jgi:N-acetylmuramoyl-L-alanine amidase
MKLTGQQIVDRARQDIGKRYVLGTFVPKDIPDYPGPFDCAEAASYWLYQVSKILFGTSNHVNPKTADAWTGWWKSDGENPELGKFIPLADAASIPGAAVLRIGTTYATGHIVLSDGEGGTVEAQGRLTGVVADTLSGRRWSTGILVNGIEYKRNPDVLPSVPKFIYRLTYPPIRGKGVTNIQNALIRHDLNPGEVDGVYGGQTFAAVIQFQLDNGLVADGEVGPLTWSMLGLGEMR